MVEQWIAGTQAMPAIVILAECAAGVLGAGLGEGLTVLPPVDLLDVGPDGDVDRDGLAPPAGAPALPGATAPPGEEAELGGGLAKLEAIGQHTRIAVVAAIEIERLWTASLPTERPFSASEA